MNVRFMKFVDVWIGTPMCLLLTLFRFVITPLRWLRRRPTEIRRVVVIKFFGLGSLLMAGPMFQAIRRKHPGVKIHLVTFEENRALLAMTGHVDEVIGISPKGPLSFVGRTIAVQLKLLLLGADAVIDLEYFSRFSVLLTYGSLAPIRIGFHLPGIWRGALLTRKVHYDHSRHITEAYLALARAIGAEGAVERPVLSAPAAAGVTGDYVVVNPNASPLCLERRWPAAYFGDLMDRLVDECHAQVVMVGSPSERDYNESVRAMSKRSESIKNLAGTTTLEGVVGLLKGAKLVVTNDSGILHLAAAAGAPVVALFGPETPVHYGPLTERKRVFYKGVPCSPCLNAYNSKTAPCNGNNICMKQITVDEVFAAVREELAIG